VAQVNPFAPFHPVQKIEGIVDAFTFLAFNAQTGAFPRSRSNVDGIEALAQKLLRRGGDGVRKFDLDP
jgi:hypothetical protein